jgi:hypothetical protein
MADRWHRGGGMSQAAILVAALLLGGAHSLKYDPCSDLKDASKVPRPAAPAAMPRADRALTTRISAGRSVRRGHRLLARRGA